MFEGGIRVSGLAARWQKGSECTTQPLAIFRQTPGYLPTNPRLSASKPVEVEGLDISTCSGLNFQATQGLCLGLRVRMKMCTLWPSALSFGSSLCSSSILPEDCTSRSSSDPASPPACLFTAKSSSSPLHRNCMAASQSHLDMGGGCKAKWVHTIAQNCIAASQSHSNMGGACMAM